MSKLEKRRLHLLRLVAILVAGVLLFFLFLWMHVSVLGRDLPKTALLRRQNADWLSRLEQVGGQLDHYEDVMGLLEIRDDRIYRSVYGMDEIPSVTRNAVPGGASRYPGLDQLDRNNLLKLTIQRLDRLEKRSYIQSKSFDDVSSISRAAGDKASHIPSIPPMSTKPGSFVLTSPFGYRSDPITGESRLHKGMDFACPPGNPVYATGDGIVILVENSFTGYGNHVEVDHGFGYVTRYSHLSVMYAYVGQKITRGDCVGLSGQSGRATGPHLHYEVIYRGDYVNPAGYMDLTISGEDYAAMVRKPSGR